MLTNLRYQDIGIQKLVKSFNGEPSETKWRWGNTMYFLKI
jgi:hypothetical protein